MIGAKQNQIVEVMPLVVSLACVVARPLLGRRSDMADVNHDESSVIDDGLIAGGVVADPPGLIE
jgi:hypothetical protein